MMRKINALISQTSQHDNSPFTQLTKQAQSHLTLQEFWLTAAPKIVGDNSFASSLTSGQLTILAYSAIVANKIKLIQAGLLIQLQNLQNSSQAFRECKVTAIVVKVQVKSHPKPVIKTPRKLSSGASNSLKQLAEQLGDSPLADKLNILASKK